MEGDAMKLSFGITWLTLTLLGLMWIVVTMIDGARWPIAPLH
jgi:hypothetical protein